MEKRIFQGGLAAFFAVIVLCAVTALSEFSGVAAASGVHETGASPVLLIDGAEAAGDAVISSGRHTLTAQAAGESVWIALYENKQFKAISFDSILEYDFPESGAEIVLFRVGNDFCPSGEAVRIRQRAPAVADGTYAGSAQCLSEYINYMVDVDVTVQDGVITEIKDRTLKTPMSSNDKVLYAAAWRTISRGIAKTPISADSFTDVDAVSGATVSSTGINAAVKNALETRSTAQEQTGDLYAPEGISLYARAYPVATVENGRIASIRIVPANDTDTERLEAFAAEIVDRQSVQGLVWPDEIQDDAFAIANLTDQMLYGTEVLK